MTKERTLHVFGKTKSQYIFPVNLTIKPVYNALKDSTEFFGVFKKEKIIKNIAYLVVNEVGCIVDLSACKEEEEEEEKRLLGVKKLKLSFPPFVACMNILGIDLKTITID